ncbi:MAG: methionine--tRNA ligase subunit beta, partial [Bacteroidales bacterium]|nr:methionine--tRNA ligase subunit beta [Bacteroidales bacterium]
YEQWLRQWILEGHKEWRSNVYGQVKSWLDGGLQPRAVTRDLDWGVPVPVEGAEGKVLYVWFDAPIGYISNTQELLPDSWEKWWKSEDTRLVHFIGKDNIVFHCIVFPAMLKAYGDGYILPDNVPANEFLNLEGDKISTSRGWAVWAHEYLKDFPGKEDVLRYVLTANAPETKDNDFSWKDFQTRNNSELVAIFGNFVNRAVVLTHKYFDGKVPAAGELLEVDREVLAQIPELKASLEKNIEGFHFREALKDAMSIARLGNKYISDTEPWKVAKTDIARTATILNVSLQICADLGIAFEAFTPFSAEKLRKMLGSPLDWNLLGQSDILKEGHQIGEAELLFSKVEDAEIQKQLDRLDAIRKEREEAAKAEAAKQVAPQKPECSFEQFESMDIRTATVLEAERVPKTDKLLKLTIDTGIDKRTIVSGIAEYYTPEQMLGKQICILANLAPRKIKGIESKGMILMARQGDGKMRFITPQEALANGAQIG